MMDNLTFAQKIIKQHTVDPLDGHTVVVIEQVGEAGEEFRFEIQPGERVPKNGIDLFRWLRGGRGGPNYFAYAVTGDPELRLKFSAPVKVDTQAHSFMLVVDVEYRVASPRLLVTRRNDDPIRKLRDEISAKLARSLAPRSWISIRHEFREIEKDAVAETIESLREFAERYGLELRHLSLACELEEGDFIDVKHEAAIEQQSEVHKRASEFERLKVVEESKTTAVKNEQAHLETLRQQKRELDLLVLEHEQQLSRSQLESKTTAVKNEQAYLEALRQKKREHDLLVLDHEQQLSRSQLESNLTARINLVRIGDAATEAAVTALKAVGGSIRTPAELVRAFQDLTGAVSGARVLIEGNGHDGLAGVAGFLTHAGQNGAAAVIADMLAQTANMSCDRMQKQQLQSGILHLVAELLRERDGEASVIEKYRTEIERIRSEANLQVDQFDYLKKFIDTEKLRSELG